MSDLVSVIVPYFRKKKYFKKCINSIFNQTYSNIEIIIVYDDENKYDLNYIKSFKIKKKKFHLIINKKNFGVGKSRNLGVKKAKGKYVAFLDSDDYWKKNKIKDQLIFMKENKISFSHTNYFIINDYNKILGLMKVKKKLNYNDLIKSCDIGTSTVMVERKLFKKYFFSSFKTKEDYFLWLKIAKQNIDILGMNKNLAFWRKTKNSLSSSFFQKICDAFRVYYSENQNIIYSGFNVIRLSVYYILKTIKQKNQLFK